MLRMPFACLCSLLSLACATAPAVPPIGNCVPSAITENSLNCVDDQGLPYSLMLNFKSDLICFHRDEFFQHEKLCHDGR